MDGTLTSITTNTASSSSNLTFTSGIDGTYDEYLFLFINLHPASAASDNAFSFNGSIDGGSNYNVAKTTSFFRAIHTENDASADVAFGGAFDLHQGTAHQWLNQNVSADADGAICGYLHLFQPSSTTFIKHFFARTSPMESSPGAMDCCVGGYLNTTSAINAVKFDNHNGHNIDSGIIQMFGVS